MDSTINQNKEVNELKEIQSNFNQNILDLEIFLNSQEYMKVLEIEKNLDKIGQSKKLINFDKQLIVKLRRKQEGLENYILDLIRFLDSSIYKNMNETDQNLILKNCISNYFSINE